MSLTPKARQRAVKLTEEALDILNKALEERWRLSGARTKLTRQARSELMGELSLPTVDKILGRQRVDRSSLTEAFKSLGVPWNDRYCESDLLTSPSEQSEGVTEPPNRPVKRRLAWMGVSVMVATAAFCAAILYPRPDWAAQYDRELAHATNLYSKGDLEKSEQHLARAMEIAESKNTARDLEAALRLRGDMAAFRGKVSAASEYYKATIRYRELRKKPTWPSVHQALGKLQIRLKEFDEAKKNLDIAEAGFLRGKELNGVAEITRDRGCLAAAMGDSDKALEWFDKALKMLATLDSPDMAIDVRGEMAMVFMQIGRLDEAQKELQVCLKHWSKSGHERWIGLTELRLSKVESKMGRPQAAIELASRARTNFIAAGDEARIADTENSLDKLGFKK